MDTNKQATNDVPAEVPANQENTPKTWGRRELIKALAATGGAVALSNVPNKWNKPEVGFGVLPAHAQASNIVDNAVYTSNCDSDPATGGDITTTPPEGQIRNATATVNIISGTGTIDNISVTVTVVPAAGINASDLVFTPALNTLNPSTNSSGTASFGDIDVRYNGSVTPQAEFSLRYSFSHPTGTVPDAQCGVYYVRTS
jgi:hypothetical protein